MILKPSLRELSRNFSEQSFADGAGSLKTDMAEEWREDKKGDHNRNTTPYINHRQPNPQLAKPDSMGSLKIQFVIIRRTSEEGGRRRRTCAIIESLKTRTPINVCTSPHGAYHALQLSSLDGKQCHSLQMKGVNSG